MDTSKIIIPTPQWRVIDEPLDSVTQMDDENDNEDLSDAAFEQLYERARNIFKPRTSPKIKYNEIKRN